MWLKIYIDNDIVRNPMARQYSRNMILGVIGGKHVLRRVLAHYWNSVHVVDHFRGVTVM